MGFASPRSYGGVGFMIDRVAARVSVRRTDLAAIDGTESLDVDAQRELSDLLLSLVEKSGKGAGLTVRDHGPQHLGLGTKTALKLSIIAGFDDLTGSERDPEKQQVVSGRGGASGIGVHGFYEGGVLWDAGRPRLIEHSLLPSSAFRATSLPLLMLRLPFPDRWRVGLCLPAAAPIHGIDERRFFEQKTPIGAESSLRAMASLYHGVLPAFRSVDLSGLASSLTELAAQGFKRLEIERYDKAVTSLLGHLHRKGFAAGMSSMGPLVYVIFDAEDDVAEVELRAICAAFDTEWLGSYVGLNRGATITRLLVT